MRNSIRFRIVVGVVFLIGLVLFPWYVLLPLVIAASFYFPFYYEILVIGILRDVLYGYEEVLPIFSVAALALWLFSLYLRPRITMH